MKYFLPILLAIAMVGCIQNTAYRKGTTTDKYGHTRIVAIPALKLQGDARGDIHLKTTGNTTTLDITTPAIYPVAHIAVLNKAGDAVIGYNDIPMFAELNNSNIIEATFKGIATAMDSTWNGLSKAVGVYFGAKGAADAAVINAQKIRW